MNGWKRRIKALLLAGALLTGIVSPAAAAQAEWLDSLTVHNGVLQYAVNPKNARFTIKTVDGLPGKTSDNDKNLTYPGSEPDTSFTTFRIDGTDYIFGQDVGVLGAAGGLEGTPVTDGTLNTAVWSANGIEVTQKLRLLSDAANPNMGNVRITYEVRNLSGETREVGSRILLDTMMGQNDASPMVLGSRYITNETLFEGEGVPGSWKSADERFAPSVVAFGMLSGWNNLAPDALLAAHWQSVSATIWEYTPSDLLNFTTDKNRYESADSAVGLYWNPRPMRAGETLVFETYYGVGSLSDSYSGSSFQVQMSAPSKLTANAAGTAYQETDFEVRVELDNATDTAVTMENVKVELGFEEGLSLARGESAVRTVERIKAGERQTLVWHLTGAPQASLMVAPYGVTVTCGDTVAEASKYIVLPGLQGPPPVMQMTGVSPENLYYLANQKKLIVKGSSFDSLKADRSWELYLEHRDTGDQVPVSQRDVYIEDTSLTVIIDPDSSFDPGMYDVVLKTENFGSMRQGVNMSTDKRYDRKEFGTLTVRSTGEGESVYEIETWDDEQALEALSKEERDSILLTMRGDLVTYELEGVQIYEAGPGTIINGAVKYTPPPDKARSPIKLFKEDGTLRAEGYGSLAIADYTFHYGDFYIELADGTEYELPDPQVTDTSYEGGSYGDEEVDDVTIVTPKNEVITDVANGIGRLLGFQVEVKNAVLGDGTVSLGGSVKLEVPMWAGKDDDDDEEEDDEDDLSADEKALKEKFGKNEAIQDGFDDAASKTQLEGEEFLSVNLEEMRYGINEQDESYLVGFIADGKVKLDDNLIPAMKFGVEASLGLDSLNYPGVYADMGVTVEVGDAFSCEAEIILVFETNGNTVPDAVKFVVSGDVIKIPLGGLGFLNKMGGGVFGLYDTIKGGYKYVPPVMISVFTGYEDPTGYAFELEDISMSVGGQGVSVRGEGGKIVGLDVIEEIYGHVLAYDTDLGPAVDMGAGFKANLLGIVKGEAAVWFIYDPTLDGLFGPVSMGGKAFVGVFIPDWIPLLGGLELLSVGAEVSTYRVFLGVTIIGIPISVGYYWEDGQVIFGDTYEGKRSRSTLSADALPAELTQGALFVSSQEVEGGTSSMVFGSNLRTTYSMPLAQSGARTRAAGPVEHVIRVHDQAYSLFELQYNGSMPNISVTQPGGKDYPLVEGENMMVQTIAAAQSQSGEDEHYVFISVEDPQDGDWTIRSSAPVGCVAKDVLPIPEVKNVTAAQSKNGTVDVSWQTNEAKPGDTVTLYLSEDLGEAPAPLSEMDETQAAAYNAALAASYDAGLKLAEGLPAADGRASVTIPDTMASGNYRIRAALVSGGDTVSSSMGADVFRYANPNTPKAPTGVTVERAGNGLFRVCYDPQEGIDGFLLTVLDEEGRALESASPVTAKASSDTALVGGVYHATVLDSAGSPTLSPDLSGVLPGETYRVSVAAYRTENGMTYPSEPVVSKPILLPEPRLPSLTASVGGVLALRDNAAGIKAASTQAEDPTLKALVRQTEPILTVTADQDCEAMLLVNGTLAQTDKAYRLSADTPLDIQLPTLVEGENKLVLVAQNASGDDAEIKLMVTVDSTPPELMLADTAPTSTGGTYSITGTAEPNAAIYVNGAAQALAREGCTFTYTGHTDKLIDTVVFTAVDRAGNETRMETDVIASELAGLQRLELRGADGSALSDPFKIDRDQTLSLSAYGIMADGTALRLPDSALRWSVPAGAGRCTVDDSGKVTTQYHGEAVVACSFPLTDGYALEQTLTLDIADVFRQPDAVRISTDALDASAQPGSTAALLSVPLSTTGVTYTYTVSGPDADYLTVDTNRLLLRREVDKAELRFTVTAQGSHVLEGLTQPIGAAFSTDFTLRVTRSVRSTAKLEGLHVQTGTKFSDLKLPETVLATLSDGTQTPMPVVWRQGGYQPGSPGMYTLRGLLQNPEGVLNSDGVEAELPVTVFVVSSAVTKPPVGSTVVIPLPGKADDGTLDLTLSDAATKEKLAPYQKSGQAVETVVIDITSGTDVARVNLTLPAAASTRLASAQAELRIATPLATATLKAESVAGLAGTDAVLSITRTAGDGLSVAVAAGGREISLPMTILMTGCPTTSGAVAVLVHPDGTTELVKKSVVTQDGVAVPIVGPASLRVIDNAKTFADVPDKSWFADAVDFVSARELFLGTGGDVFSPGGAMNRAMLATVLQRLENGKSTAAGVYTDVPSDAWYAGAVSWAAERGLVSGVGGGQFDPLGYVTREQLAVILYRYAGSPAVSGTLSFTDADAVSPWADAAMAWAVERGILTGRGNGTLAPAAAVTRAEVSAMLQRYCAQAF